MKKIEMVDLKSQYQKIQSQVNDSVLNTLNSALTQNNPAREISKKI